MSYITNKFISNFMDRVVTVLYTEYSNSKNVKKIDVSVYHIWLYVQFRFLGAIQGHSF